MKLRIVSYCKQMVRTVRNGPCFDFDFDRAGIDSIAGLPIQANTPIGTYPMPSIKIILPHTAIKREYDQIAVH